MGQQFSKSVLTFDKDGKFLGKYRTIEDAKALTGVPKWAIRKADRTGNLDEKYGKYCFELVERRKGERNAEGYTINKKTSK